jgi:hypothetical protein
MLAALAREVPRIELGTCVSGITHRPVAVLAKQAVTVDHLSGGRLILGIGAAWNQAEHAAYGIRLPPTGERVGLVGVTKSDDSGIEATFGCDGIPALSGGTTAVTIDLDGEFSVER